MTGLHISVAYLCTPRLSAQILPLHYAGGLVDCHCLTVDEVSFVSAGQRWQCQLDGLHNADAGHEPTQQKYTSKAAMTTPLTTPGLTASLRSDLLGLPMKARSFSSSAMEGFITDCHRGSEQEEAKESTCLVQRLRLGLQNQPLHCVSPFLPPHPRA